MSSIALPALDVRPPQPQDPLAGLEKLTALRGMLNQQALFPGQQQIQQEQIKQQGIATQEAQLNLQDKLGISQALKDSYGAAAATASGNAGTPSTDQPKVITDPSSLPGTPQDRITDLVNRIQDPKYGISAMGQIGLIEQYTKLRSTVAAADKDTFDSIASAHKLISQGLSSVLEAAPEDQAAQWTIERNALTRNPTLAKFANMVPAQYPGTPAPAGSPEAQQLVHRFMAEQDIVAAAREGAEYPGQVAASKLAQQKADIVTQLSTPEMLANPGAQAAIQAKIQDPKTDPADIPRLHALLPKAAVAQQQAVRQKAREAAATQAVAQGDPNAAGQLLASRTLTIDEMKVRGLTPDFQAKAIQAAQRIDPNFKAPEAAAQGKIATSAAYSQFFGNTDSLLVKGGTLDQLAARGDALGNTMIPKYNTLANWTKAALGQGPQAAYAATALGVADDYSKVMTGSGQGSDTSRQQALDIIGRDLSPAGRAAAADAIRQAVRSQRQGRIGSNPYLRDMYPDPQGAAPGGGGGGQVQVKDPRGVIHSFPDQKSADGFKKAAGIQ